MVKNYNVNFLVLDETGESNLLPAQRENLIYALSNGKQKMKGQKIDGVFTVNHQTERNYFSLLVSGEASFLKSIDTAGRG